MTEDERGQLEVERVTELALLRHRRHHAALTGGSLEFCEACGNEIPEPRRVALAGVKLCIECKRAEELATKRMVNDEF
ncbi:MAG: TraR/DksA C4-type zinc finger protein [Methylovulum sp.]|uniref:TraR/DksA C4-type zinc finger protein n=1 Tax=Methylovulum sp. TaxID=1916980 RepID=UPI00261C8CF9|nr:TraR/DksA C4-type zinc finger protein [Methylovulum sp.]MDD2725194.1 TraR/DksA C4-type zinc finger protein [Methylovulum sp.]MDD5125447.1 TraR/DksA C4-type zinc finger protein [Methylovulum sp.]